MNENDDFEKKLRAFLGNAPRPDPTQAWKEDILSRALRESAANPVRLAPPRILMVGWVAALAAIVLLSLTTPENPDHFAPHNVAVEVDAQQSHAGAVASDTISTSTLIALERQYSLTGDLQ